jgi:intracellular sulfur oxidation DsrE/DsrF family protein
MGKNMFKIMPVLTAGILALSFSVVEPVIAQSDKPHKLVIQVSTDDPAVQKTALNNAVNLQKMVGLDQVDIEVVAYGPGLSLFTSKSPEAFRVPDLAQQEITFSACENTMKHMVKKSGKEVELVDGVRVVPAGVLRILELQEQGYAYLRP